VTRGYLPPPLGPGVAGPHNHQERPQNGEAAEELRQRAVRAAPVARHTVHLRYGDGVHLRVTSLTPEFPQTMPHSDSRATHDPLLAAPPHKCEGVRLRNFCNLLSSTQGKSEFAPRLHYQCKTRTQTEISSDVESPTHTILSLLPKIKARQPLVPLPLSKTHPNSITPPCATIHHLPRSPLQLSPWNRFQSAASD
jgi:hypothetical protein